MADEVKATTKKKRTKKPVKVEAPTVDPARPTYDRDQCDILTAADGRAFKVRSWRLLGVDGLVRSELEAPQTKPQGERPETD